MVTTPAALDDLADAHALTADEVVQRLGVDPARGLDTTEVVARREQWGANVLDEPTPRPRWLRFVDQFRNLLVALLVVAAVVAGAIGDVKDSIAIAVVLLFNATLGYVQEQKAARNLAALRAMLSLTTTVRRGGVVLEVPTGDIVRGDVVLVEAGDRVPADGRVVEARAAQVDESSLTGESIPVDKRSDAMVAVDAALGDRTTAVLMNTQVTQGRIVFVVTATGMGTEVGKVAAIVNEDDDSRTPLQRQLDGLGKRLAAISGAIVVVYFALGVGQGQELSETLISAVALLVAAIPEGLPAVVTLTLAVGTARLAKRGAIVKQLSSVETLGSTSVICSDKTGTLTMNQMTVRRVWTPDGELEVGGDGYEVTEPIVEPRPALRRLAEIGVLCNDSQVRDGELLGDPTEGSLVVLAEKAGVRVDELRADVPRLAEIPFDSARKFMLTVNALDGHDVVAVKGAWEVVAGRCAFLGDTRRELTTADLDHLAAVARSFAARGLRVLAIASGTTTASAVAGDAPIDELQALADGLVLHGVVGLLDPPRAEVAEAIKTAVGAGIAVKMVTGDHVDTARAIASQIGIAGDALSGTDIDALDDEQLASRMTHVGVVARVSPNHKVRVVRALRANGAVVAMTGDGVNDAAALSIADIGVAMGDSGTEVAKDAADLVLTDDNFTTIARAVEQGRTIYGNIVKFVRFQLATNIGALATLIGAQVAGLPVPFNPIQLLWINIIMDGPPAMALGVDPGTPGEMQRPPRTPGDQILSRRRLTTILTAGVIMAVITLGLLVAVRDAATTEQALTLAFTSFVFMQVVNALNVRHEQRSIFSRSTFSNRSLLVALAGVVVLQVAAVQLPVGQDVFGTTSLTAVEWAVAIAATLVFAATEEVAKGVRRRRARAAR
jgi:Ca2+-transporting ATPase